MGKKFWSSTKKKARDVLGERLYRLLSIIRHPAFNIGRLRRGAMEGALHGIVKHYNWWDNKPSWLSIFINHYFPNKTGMICIYTVHGPKVVLNLPFMNIGKRVKKVFLTIEDVHVRTCFKEYSDLCLNRVDISMGFDNIGAANYIRFPYWIISTFEPTDTEDDVRKKINDINQFRPSKDRTKDCALIARVSWGELRTEMYHALGKYLSIECPSDLFHNSDDLKIKFGDNKIDYLKQFRFNICPENRPTAEYVTEKIFDSFIAGCIPIYNGSENNPEPGIINKNALIFWERGTRNEDAIRKIDFLNKNQSAYEEFTSQERLFPYATEYVCERLAILRQKLTEILE